jgi:hypothetical protein
MKKWFVENSLGLFPPVLERNLKGCERGIVRPRVNYRECSVSYMMYIEPLRKLGWSPSTLVVRGYQVSRARATGVSFRTSLHVEDGRYTVGDVRETRMTCFSCHDNTILYIFIEGNGRMCVCHCQFNGCCALRDPRIPIYEMELFESDGFRRTGQRPVFMLHLKCINIKNKIQGPLHYSWAEPGIDRNNGKEPVCTIAFEAKEYDLHEYECIFCFRRYSCFEDLLFHLRHLHLNYILKWSKRTGSPSKRIEMERIEDDGDVACEDKRAGSSFCYRSSNHRMCKADPVKIQKEMPRLACPDEKEFLHPADFLESLACLANRNIEKNTVLPQDSIALMKKWNRLRLAGDNVLDDIRRFVEQEHNNPCIIEFLFVLYHKCVINPHQMVELVTSLCMVADLSRRLDP